MTAAEKLRMEIAQEAPFSKDEFISKISRLINLKDGERVRKKEKE